MDQADREHSGAGILNHGPRILSDGEDASRDTRKAPVMCREWSADSFAGAVLNAGGTAEHDSIQSVFENDGNEFFTHSRIVSRPGICNSIPGRDFCVQETKQRESLEPESTNVSACRSSVPGTASFQVCSLERRVGRGIFDRN